MAGGAAEPEYSRADDAIDNWVEELIALMSDGSAAPARIQ